jgi:hypothetical protein
MLASHLPASAPLEAFEAQAAALLTAHAARDPRALRAFHAHHPRFLDPAVPWKPLPVTDEVIAAAALSLDDARLALARAYSFRDWDALVALVRAAEDRAGPVARFEAAVDAVVGGDLATLDGLLAEDPGLVRARSTRVTCHDPPVHGATLVHYLAANGVEGYRQRSPANAVAVARRLFAAGAEPDALAGTYGGRHPALPLLVSSTPPAEAGVQVPLVHAFLDAGADVEGRGDGAWRSPLLTALVFGFPDAARALVDRGARVETLAAAAGLGRVDEVRRRLPAADAGQRHAALALAAQLGQAAVVALLLDAGEDPDRPNPPGIHAHATPLHQAALAGHAAVVRLLVERGARRDLRDGVWDATPLEWAEHGGWAEVAAYLRAVG